ncbi:MAG: hypothetical protein AAFN30_00190, partial [Actinomycetota bacterium]
KMGSITLGELLAHADENVIVAKIKVLGRLLQGGGSLLWGQFRWLWHNRTVPTPDASNDTRASRKICAGA